MSYNENGNGGSQKTTIYENYGTVFNGERAYSLGMSNNKFRIAIAKQLRNNGNPSCDFKNQTGISLDFNDVYRLYLASCQIARLYVAIRKNPSLINSNPVYTTTFVRVPLVAKSTGNIYGSIQVGFQFGEDKTEPPTFYIQYEYKSPKDDAEVKDYYYFRKAIGNEGVIEFCDSHGNVTTSTQTYQLDFANFIITLESALKSGRLLYGVHSAIRYSGGGSGYRNNNYNSAPSGAPNSGYSSDAGSSNDFDEGIPF